MRKPDSYSVLIFVAAAVIVADQLTKWWILAQFSLYETRIIIPGFFNLTSIRNTGAAFGFLAGNESGWRPWFFGIIALVALVAIVFLFRQYRDKGSLYAYALASIAGGAIGNLIDRVRFGAVVDFLDFYIGRYHWPAFNVADSAIVVGVGLFLLAGFVYPEPEEGGSHTR
ncbi:MAG: lipoprotein signal peptidase [Desulfobulbaceae bacterium]|uniref:Lipoprotein signal peptidase n=1 Tax=Candidatus Desulfobia pelagia TaxID=2841692 RepID=A0A8J6TAI7_9BACT|nr:lipoprotein signal peptidase [Candidatus Desulfobia pelagia]